MRTIDVIDARKLLHAHKNSEVSSWKSIYSDNFLNLIVLGAKSNEVSELGIMPFADV